MFIGIRNTLYVRFYLVILTWMLGLLSGFYFVRVTSLASLVYSFFNMRISILGLLILLVFPLLLSYIISTINHFRFILPIIFLKAFSFMYCYGCISFAYGSAGWLVAGMVLLSDGFLVICLIQFWFHLAFNQVYSLRRFLASYVVPLLLIGCFDYYVVSPYVRILLNY